MELRDQRTTRRRVNLPPAPIWMFLGTLSIACFLLMVTFGMLFLGRSNAPISRPTAILEIIPANTFNLNITLTPDAPLIGSETVPPAPLSGDFSVGAYVQVTGTGGEGLRLRDTPGLNTNVIIVASEAEVFKLEDGPVEMDGYTWWHLVGPFDESRQGWAVANYLELVQNP